MNSKFALIIFVKAPVKGNVKTRLAKGTSEEFAAEFYRRCAEHTFSEVLKLYTDIYTPFIYCHDKNEIDFVSKWAGSGFIIKPQIIGNLGVRMTAAFKEVFNLGFSKALIIGTDVPDISKDIIKNAFSKLQDYDYVIGPSSDGGYYLIGMKKLNHDIFNEIDWSTSKVLQTTLERIESSGRKYFLLDEKTDIDTKEDLLKWKKTCNKLDNPLYEFVINYNEPFD